MERERARAPAGFFQTPLPPAKKRLSADRQVIHSPLQMKRGAGLVLMFWFQMAPPACRQAGPLDKGRWFCENKTGGFDF